MSDTETPEIKPQVDDEAVNADTNASDAQQQARLTTAELQATLERLEALTAETNILKLENEALQAEKSRLEDSWKRSEAEMANLRRRTEREIAENSKYAISSFARDVIGIADNIRRAIEAVPKQAAASDPALANLLEGVEVTEREVFKVLERQNIVRFDPKGEKFDPHVHEAMMRVETSDTPPETVVQVIQAGYMLGERVLRAAAVVVAKAGSGIQSNGPAGGSMPTESNPEEEAAQPRVRQNGNGDGAPRSSPNQDDDADASSATVVKMQRRDGDGGAPARRAQIIRPVTVTTSVLSTKRPSSMTRPVIGQGGQPNREAPSSLPNDPDDLDYDGN